MRLTNRFNRIVIESKVQAERLGFFIAPSDRSMGVLLGVICNYTFLSFRICNSDFIRNADQGRILGPSRSQEIQEGDSVEIGVFGKYVDPKRIKLSPATFARTGMDRKIIRTLGEYGQNLAAAPRSV